MDPLHRKYRLKPIRLSIRKIQPALEIQKLKLFRAYPRIEISKVPSSNTSESETLTGKSHSVYRNVGTQVATCQENKGVQTSSGGLTSQDWLNLQNYLR